MAHCLEPAAALWGCGLPAAVETECGTWTVLGSYVFCLRLGEVLALLVFCAALHEEGQRRILRGWETRKEGFLYVCGCLEDEQNRQVTALCTLLLMRPLTPTYPKRARHTTYLM